MSILEDLFYGNIDPSVDGFKQGDRYKHLFRNVIEKQDILEKELNSEQFELMEQMLEMKAEMNCIEIKEIFTEGFKIGTRIILAALVDDTL